MSGRHIAHVWETDCTCLGDRLHMFFGRQIAHVWETLHMFGRQIAHVFGGDRLHMFGRQIAHVAVFSSPPTWAAALSWRFDLVCAVFSGMPTTKGLLMLGIFIMRTNVRDVKKKTKDCCIICVISNKLMPTLSRESNAYSASFSKEDGPKNWKCGLDWTDWGLVLMSEVMAGPEFESVAYKLWTVVFCLTKSWLTTPFSLQPTVILIQMLLSLYQIPASECAKPVS